MKMTSQERRELGRTVRLHERTTDMTLQQIADALRFSRMHCYRCVQELEEFEKTSPAEAKAAWQASFKAEGAKIKALQLAGTSVEDAANAMYGVVTPYTMAIIEEEYGENSADPLLL